MRQSRRVKVEVDKHYFTLACAVDQASWRPCRVKQVKLNRGTHLALYAAARTSYETLPTILGYTALDRDWENKLPTTLEDLLEGVGGFNNHFPLYSRAGR